jgi:hypothetical protein
MRCVCVMRLFFFFCCVLNEQPSDQARRQGRRCGVLARFLAWLFAFCFLGGFGAKLITFKSSDTNDIVAMKLLVTLALHFSRSIIAPKWPVLLSKTSFHRVGVARTTSRSRFSDVLCSLQWHLFVEYPRCLVIWVVPENSPRHIETQWCKIVRK